MQVCFPGLYITVTIGLHLNLFKGRDPNYLFAVATLVTIF